MAITTRSARITGTVAYRAKGGKSQRIPLGPCLVEQADDHHVDIVWGAQGQRSAALTPDAVEAAQQLGHLVWLD